MFMRLSKRFTRGTKKIRQAVLTSNGELLFAKGIVLGEGETEVQAFTYFLPATLGIDSR